MYVKASMLEATRVDESGWGENSETKAEAQSETQDTEQSAADAPNSSISKTPSAHEKYVQQKAEEIAKVSDLMTTFAVFIHTNQPTKRDISSQNVCYNLGYSRSSSVFTVVFLLLDVLKQFIFLFSYL